MEQAIKAARNAKMLTPNVTSSFSSGYTPPKVLNYVVAYDGPAQMQTVYNWIPQIHAALGETIPDLPQDESQRLATASPSIDGAFVLSKGFLYFDNVPVGFANAASRATHPNLKWVFADTGSGNLLLLFMLLQTATANVEGKWLNPIPYLATFNVPGLHLGIV